MNEVGWGEFEIMVRIYFKDAGGASDPPVSATGGGTLAVSGGAHPLEFKHLLRLYSTDGIVNNAKKPVVSEFYDEVILNNPPLCLPSTNTLCYTGS